MSRRSELNKNWVGMLHQLTGIKGGGKNKLNRAIIKFAFSVYVDNASLIGGSGCTS